MNQPLSVKTVVIPAGQNKYGYDVVRFTADYAASGLYGMCIGCYPPCHSDLRGIVVVDDPVSDDSPPWAKQRITASLPSREIDPRKANSGVCATRDPGGKRDSLLDKLGTSTVDGPMVPHYWDV